MSGHDTFADIKDLSSYKATVARGMEELLCEELELIGATHIKIDRGVVAFQGSREILYRANLRLRTAMRILMPLFTFKAHNEDRFYYNIMDFPWENLYGLNDTFAIDSASRSRYFKHSLYVSQLTKDAIADRFRKMSGQRPSVDTKRPDFRIHVHIDDDQCTVSLDSSGEPLYKRGYRKVQSQAPLKETLAAALIMFTGWDGTGTFIDPMCGSGTIPLEAALIAMNRAPGIYRHHFGFMNWSDYDEDLYNSVRKSLREEERSFTGTIIGRDSDDEVIGAARKNSMTAGMDTHIQWEQMDFTRSTPPDTDPGILLMNPPYDERIELDDQDAFYKQLGDVLKQKYPGYDAWVFSGALKAMRKIGLKPDKKIPLFNGAIESNLCHYKMIARKTERDE